MCTKWTETFAIPNIEAKTVAEIFVNEIVSCHGAPRVLLSDRGSKFLSSLFREFCFLMNTDKIFTTGYRPQANGLVERFNVTLAQKSLCMSAAIRRTGTSNLNFVLFTWSLLQKLPGSLHSTCCMVENRRCPWTLPSFPQEKCPHSSPSTEPVYWNMWKGCGALRQKIHNKHNRR